MRIKVIKTEKDWEVMNLIVDFNILSDITKGLLKSKKIDKDWVRANQAEMKSILKKIRKLELSEDLNLSVPLKDLKTQFNQLARINKRLGKNKELSYRQNAMFTDNLLTLLNLLLKIVELAQYDDSE